MKFSILLKSIFYTLLLILSTNNIKAQCSKEKLCDKTDLRDYDTRSQSRFIKLAPGDTSKFSIVAYANNELMIVTCSETHLGVVEMNVYESQRVKEKYIKEILTFDGSEEETDEWEEESSNYYDEYGEEEETETEEETTPATPDTIWAYSSTVQDILVFNSINNEKNVPYYNELVKKTIRLTIEVIVPAGDPKDVGCVNIYVGRKTVDKKGYSYY